MRELRHDFRAIYHVCYDEVEPGECVDLILTLPRGCAYRNAVIEFGELTDEQDLALSLMDLVQRLIHLMCTGTTEGAPRAMRPEDMRERKRRAAASRDVRDKIENTNWEDV